MRTHLLLLPAVASIYCTNISAQQKDETSLSEADTISNFSAFKRSLSFSGVLQTRYMASLNEQVDVNGKHFNPF